MTLFDKPKRPAQWEPDPLLAPVQSQPHFLRVNWNEKQAKDFGPWRVAPLGEPLDAVEVPQEDIGAEPYAQLREASDSPMGGVALIDIDGVPASDGPSVDEVQPPAGPVHSPDDWARMAEEAHARGWSQGYAQAQTEAQQQHDERLALLNEVMSGLQALNHEPQRFFEPLKRLALHMAEQLVRGELQVSGQAVANLVKQALDTLGETREKVILHLHPLDADALGETAPDWLAQCALEVDAQLQRGSLRVSVNDTVVEDLIEHRLEALARRVLAQPDAWLRHASLIQPLSPVAPRWTKSENKPAVCDVEDVNDLRDTNPPDAGMSADPSSGNALVEPRHD